MIKLKTITRRSFIKKWGKMYLGLLGVAMLGAYSFFEERFRYQIREVDLSVKNLPKVFDGWTIVHFSDLHFGFYYGVKEFRRVVTMVNALKPDILLFTGDLVNRDYLSPELAVPLLQELKAPRGGKWAVLGNHDYVSKEKVVKSLQDAQFIVLENNRRHIEVDGQRIYIAGLEDVFHGSPNLEQALVGLSDQDCVLLLAHEPDLADSSCQYPVNAQFSGHSHGGQVCLPFYGPLFTPNLAQKYVDGLYYVGKRKMPLYVNRGIGTTRLPIRFFCRPEITLFKINKGEFS